MDTLYSFKIQGQTTSDVAIATVSVTITGDGYLVFTGSGPHARRIPIAGDFADLVKKIFTGTDGLDADDAPARGHVPMV